MGKKNDLTTYKNKFIWVKDINGLKKTLLLDHQPAYNSRILNVGVEEQKKYPKGEFKTEKGCHILKVKKVNDNEPP